jgi:hypothetical protein
VCIDCISGILFLVGWCYKVFFYPKEKEKERGWTTDSGPPPLLLERRKVMPPPHPGKWVAIHHLKGREMLHTPTLTFPDVALKNTIRTKIQ